MKNRKKIRYIFTYILLLLIITGIGGSYIYINIPLRTAIFRSLIKGNWYLTSEKDTLYSFGYYGVKKWLVQKNNNLKKLAQNDSFCHNTYIGYLIGRSGAIHDQYLYVTSRSYLGGNDTINNKNYINGKLLVLRKNDLKIIKTYKSDIKLIEAKICNNLLVVSGLKGFDIYDISIAQSPQIMYKYRQNNYTEFQGFTFIQKDSCLYIAFTKFGEGLSLWKITQTNKIFHLADVAIQDTLIDGSILPKGLQCFNIISNYPFLYSTIAPSSNIFNTKNDKRGIMVYDISDINHIKQSAIFIPRKDWYKKKTGDPEPSYIDIYKNKLYTNFGEKGIAIFDISNPSKPRYEGIIDITNNNNLIQPIHINHRGILFAGDYYWPDIYSKQLND